MHAQQTILAALLFTTASSVIADPIDLIVDPNQSSIDLTMTVDVSLASDSDSDSSPLSGSLRMELDDYGMPTEISLHDLHINIDNTLNFNWSFGFFGSADATLQSGAVTWGSTDAFVGPVPINDDLFSMPEVPVALQGSLDVAYDIFLVGSGSESVNLADQGDFLSSVDGMITVVDGTIMLSSTLPLSATTPLMDSDGNTLGTLTVEGSATLVATAQAPSCPADLNGDGVLNFFDVSAFLNAFSSQDPAADFDQNGVFNFFDVSGFLNAFTSGCP